MFLLRFAFQNHRSFRDEVDITLVDPKLKTNVPRDGDWVAHTSRVAAIYGPNASGKSGVMDAIRYAQAAIAHSATDWTQRNRMPRVPFALDDHSKRQPSSYVFDFVLDGVRHEYGFSVSRTRVEEEWLYLYPTARRRVVFERGIDGADFHFGREFGAGASLLRSVTDQNQLILSNGPFAKHELLTRISNALLNEIVVARFGESDRESRLRDVMRDVVDGSLSLEDLKTMLRVADVGIEAAEVREVDEVDPRFLRIVQALEQATKEAEDSAAPDSPEGTSRSAASAEVSDDADETGKEEVDQETLERIFLDMSRSLMFEHRGADDRTYSLPSREQSTGTLTWLSLAAPAIRTLRTGGVLAVDELDASLHPQLAQVMIQMFRDESVNLTGAQLIFTTHDTFFLSPTSDVQLQPHEVWLVEKDRDGRSDLYRLSDFSPREKDNLSRRYLQGRYGGVPSVAPSFLAALVQVGASSEREDELS